MISTDLSRVCFDISAAYVQLLMTDTLTLVMCGDAVVFSLDDGPNSNAEELTFVQETKKNNDLTDL